MKEDEREKEPLVRVPAIDQVLAPWYDWKSRFNKAYGISFGLDYNVLALLATDSLGEEGAAGGIFRFFGNWTVTGRDSGNTGSMVFKVENRHHLGTDIVPGEQGFEIGYAGLTGAQFGDLDWALTNLHWLQKTFNGRLNFVAGIVDPTDYLNIYGLVNPLTAFSNLAFLTDATIPAPSQGLGAAIGGLWKNIYLLGGLVRHQRRILPTRVIV